MNVRISALLLVTLLACDRVHEAPALESVAHWNLADGPSAIDLAPDGRTAVVAAHIGAMTLLREPWREPIVFRLQSDGAQDVRIAGSLLMFVSRDGSIERRAAADGGFIAREQALLERPSRRALAAVGGRYVAFDTRVYDLQTQRWIADEPLPSSQTALAFAGDRYALFASIQERSVSLHPLNGDAPNRFQPDEEPRIAAVSDDGKYVAAGSENEVVVWSRNRTCRESTRDAIDYLHFGNGWLAAAGGRWLHILRIPDCTKLTSVALVGRAIAFDADSQLIALGDDTGEVYVWDVLAARMLGRVHATDYLRLLRVHAFTRSLWTVADADSGHDLQLWRIAQRAL